MKKIRMHPWLSCFWLLTMAATPLAAWAQIRIELRPQVQVARPQVMLGDVANISTHELATLQALMSISLGSAPATGTSVSLERSVIERWVKNRFQGAPSSTISWGGAQRVEFSTMPRELAGDMVLKEARAALLAWLKPRASRVEVVELGAPRNVLVPQGVVVLQVRPLPDMLTPAKRMMVWVDILVDDQFIKSVPVSFQVNAFRNGWIAKQDMHAGILIDRSAVEQQEVDVAEFKQGVALAEDAEIASVRLKHAMRSGTPVVRNNLEKMPAVVRGEQVTLQAHSGLVSLEGQAEVLQDGFIGQMIRVRAKASDRPVLVRVTGSGRVEMTE